MTASSSDGDGDKGIGHGTATREESVTHCETDAGPRSARVERWTGLGQLMTRVDQLETTKETTQRKKREEKSIDTNWTSVLSSGFPGGLAWRVDHVRGREGFQFL